MMYRSGVEVLKPSFMPLNLQEVWAAPCFTTTRVMPNKPKDDVQVWKRHVFRLTRVRLEKVLLSAHEAAPLDTHTSWGISWKCDGFAEVRHVVDVPS